MITTLGDQAIKEKQPTLKPSQKKKRGENIIRRTWTLAWQNAKQIFRAFRLELRETGYMVSTYRKQLLYRAGMVNFPVPPSQEELLEANEQLRDIPKFLPFFTLIFIPVPGITELYIITAGTVERFSGNSIRLLPTQFSALVKKKKAPVKENVEVEIQNEEIIGHE